jgi:hypothetical protein
MDRSNLLFSLGVLTHRALKSCFSARPFELFAEQADLPDRKNTVDARFSQQATIRVKDM